MKTNKSQKNTPSDWQQVKLGDICHFKKGKGLSKDDLIIGGKYEAIHYGELFTKYNEKIEHILSRTNNNKNVFLSKKNDILMPTSDVTPRGLSTASFINKDGVILGGDVLVIRPISNILNGLFFSNFVSANKKEIIKLVSGTTVFHLYGSDMAKLKFYLPTLSEQNRIVSVLETWDKAIEKLSKKIRIKKQIKKGLMQNLLTGKKRLKEFSDKWKTVILNDVVDFINGKAHENDILENGKYIVVNSKFISSNGRVVKKSNSLYCPAQINDILMVMSDVPNGKAIAKCFLVKKDNTYTVNQRICILKSKINSTFLFYKINRNHYYLSFDDGVKQTNLRREDVLGCTLTIPESQIEQEAIANIIITSDKEIQILEEKLQTIKDQKKYLLNNLITGTIRTPENLKIN